MWRGGASVAMKSTSAYDARLSFPEQDWQGNQHRLILRSISRTLLGSLTKSRAEGLSKFRRRRNLRLDIVIEQCHHIGVVAYYFLSSSQQDFYIL